MLPELPRRNEVLSISHAEIVTSLDQVVVLQVRGEINLMLGMAVIARLTCQD